MKYLILALTLVTTTALADTVPNSKFTPGKADPNLTKEVLCGDTFRTPNIRNVTEKTKHQVYSNYNVSNHAGYCAGPEGCEIDHLISLEIGGSNDAQNLWPQPFDGILNAHMKDILENKLHSMVCKGQISLDQAQKEISTDWVGAYKKYVTPK